MGPYIVWSCLHKYLSVPCIKRDFSFLRSFIGHQGLFLLKR